MLSGKFHNWMNVDHFILNRTKDSQVIIEQLCISVCKIITINGKDYLNQLWIWWKWKWDWDKIKISHGSLKSLRNGIKSEYLLNLLINGPKVSTCMYQLTLFRRIPNPLEFCLRECFLMKLANFTEQRD